MTYLKTPEDWCQALEDDNWGDAADAWRADRAALLSLLDAAITDPDISLVRLKLELCRICRILSPAALAAAQGDDSE